MTFRSIVGAFALGILASACAHQGAHQAAASAPESAVRVAPKSAANVPAAATKGEILARRLYAEVYEKTLPAMLKPLNLSVAASLREMSTSDDLTPQERQGLDKAIADLPALLDEEMDRFTEQMILTTGQEMDRLAQPGDLDALVAFTDTPTGNALLRKLLAAGVEAAAAAKAGADTSSRMESFLSSDDIANLAAFTETPAGSRFGKLLAESNRAAQPKLDAIMAANNEGMGKRIAAFLCERMGGKECATP